jgi:hypothetical protein
MSRPKALKHHDLHLILTALRLTMKQPLTSLLCLAPVVILSAAGIEMA